LKLFYILNNSFISFINDSKFYRNYNSIHPITKPYILNFEIPAEYFSIKNEIIKLEHPLLNVMNTLIQSKTINKIPTYNKPRIENSKYERKLSDYYSLNEGEISIELPVGDISLEDKLIIINRLYLDIQNELIRNKFNMNKFMNTVYKNNDISEITDAYLYRLLIWLKNNLENKDIDADEIISNYINLFNPNSLKRETHSIIYQFEIINNISLRKEQIDLIINNNKIIIFHL
jgi:hypothetical protein